MRRHLLIAIGVISVACIAMAWSWHHASDAAAACQRTELSWQETQQALRRLGTGMHGSVGGAPTDDDLLARLQGALQGAGLPVTAISSLQPHAGKGRGERSVQVQVNGLAAAQIGTWLQAVEADRGPWQVRECQLVRSPGTTGSATIDTTMVLATPAPEGSP